MRNDARHNRLEDFIAELEATGSISRKERRMQEARRLSAEASSLFKRIEECLRNLKIEMDPHSGAERASRGWANSAFRESLRVVELTIDAFCAGCGLHIPRRNSAGVRKRIALFLLESVEDESPHAMGEIRKQIKEGYHAEGIRRGRHALNIASPTQSAADSLIWLRRRVKYPGTDIPHDDLRHEIERAMHIARSIHTSFLMLTGKGSAPDFS